jgi:predicted transcriptional regulator
MKTTPAKPEKKPTLADYEAWKEDQIRLGLEDFEKGRVFSHEEVVKRSEARLKKLEKKYAKAA